MRTVTTTHNIYKYNELSEDAKIKVKDWFLSNPDRTSYFKEDVEEELNHVFGKGNNLEIQFSLGYCQGDGFNIYGSIAVSEVVYYLKNFCEDFLNPFTNEELETILSYAEHTDGIELPHNNRYCYCIADRIGFADEFIEQLQYAVDCKVIESINEELIKDFEDVVQNVFGYLCGRYEEWGYEYFYEISDCDMSEICEANDWEFYEDGKLF